MRQTLVMVSDPGDERRGEITLAGDPGAAARLIGTLLESGCPQSRIRVFHADGIEMRVQHRPVVSISRAGPAGNYSGDDAESFADDQGDPIPFVKDGVRFSSLFRPV